MQPPFLFGSGAQPDADLPYSTRSPIWLKRRVCAKADAVDLRCQILDDPTCF